jgi:hypothetical protein
MSAQSGVDPADDQTTPYDDFLQMMLELARAKRAAAPHWKSVAQEESDDLDEMMIKLKIADRALQLDPENPRAAALEALRVVIQFLHARPANHMGGFSRPLELLVHELSQLGAAPPGMILPPYNGGSGGVNRRRVINTLKGHAAFAVELLVRTKMTRKDAAAEILAVLERHGFDHGVRRKNKAEGFLRTIDRYEDKTADSVAAKCYKMLCAENKSSEPWERYNIIGWLVMGLQRHGFIERL